jgi:hypothetical protein
VGASLAGLQTDTAANLDQLPDPGIAPDPPRHGAQRQRVEPGVLGDRGQSRLVRRHLVQVDGIADPVAPQRPDLVLDVNVKARLRDPVEQLIGTERGLEDQLDDVSLGEALSIVDADLAEPHFMVPVHASIMRSVSEWAEFSENSSSLRNFSCR